MATYIFQSETGERIERDFPMTEGPPESVEHEGQRYRRVFTVPGMKVPDYGVQYADQKLPVSRALPRRKTSEGTERGGIIEYRDGLRTDREGRPIVANKADEKNWIAKTGYTKED
ncbi:MAG TPA: hypothetical protein VKA74_12065 [Myxococcota bacterium]|nr:hypothetical protein [Myxococcota bacterium]